MKVLFLTTIPSPYRVAFFNELGKKCDLIVLFEKKRSDERNENWLNENYNNFQAYFLNGVKIKANKAFCPGVIKAYKHINPDIVIVGGYNTPTAMLFIEYLRLNKKSFVLNADGGFVKKDRKITAKIKTHFISSAKYCIGTSKYTMEYFIHYGADKDRLMQYPFTSIYKKDIISKPLSTAEKESAKNRVGINEKQMILMVGQFIKRKGIDILLRACKGISDDVGVYIIGGRESEEYCEIARNLELKNIHFLDFMTTNELEKYYMAADLFVLPTREDIWGLVINEAIAYGLPVITTNKCIAGLEIIQNDINGYIVPVEDYNELSKKISLILKDETLRNVMTQNNIKRAHEYSIENMAEVHYQLLKSL